jgi:pimeloyl-ACP methyl ester carboxylesterase
MDMQSGDPARGALARLAIKSVMVVVALYAMACTWLYFNQASLLYFPVHAADTRSQQALPGREVRVLYSVRERAGDEALVYFGGNAEDTSRTLADLANAFPQRSIYTLHYRGYGGSAGRPGEGALRGDAIALYDLARARHARVLLVGRSLGSGLAVQVAARRDPARLVLVTPYDSIVALGRAHYPWLPVGWLARERFDSASLAARVRAPTLLLVAGADTLVPRANSARLRARFAPGVASWRVVPGASHNDVSSRADYFAGWQP